MAAKKAEQTRSSSPKRKMPHTHEGKGKLMLPVPNSAILFIYGVTTPWSYERVTLPKYVVDNLSEFISKYWNDKLLQRLIDRIRKQTSLDNAAGADIPLIEPETSPKEVIQKSVVKNILYQLDHPQRSQKAVIESIENMIWHDGYESGKLKAQIFDDVYSALDKWKMQQFVKFYSYAVAKPRGQKLFLKSTIKGDLTKYFNNYFDATGAVEGDVRHYKQMLGLLLERRPEKVVVFTDNPNEARAAIGAGMRSILVLRSGNDPIRQEDLDELIHVRSFNEIEFVEIEGDPVACC